MKITLPPFRIAAALGRSVVDRLNPQVAKTAALLILMSITGYAVFVSAVFKRPVISIRRENILEKASTPRKYSRKTSIPIEWSSCKLDALNLEEKGKAAKQGEKASCFFERIDNDARVEMVLIQENAVPAFAIGRSEVTQAQWRAVARLPTIKTFMRTETSIRKGDDLPVDSVLWDEAVEFCQRLSIKTGRNYRLPSEAEWDSACQSKAATSSTSGRSGQKSTRGPTSYDNTAKNRPLFESIFHWEKLPVDNSKLVNASGLYGMSSGVWEWCQDVYEPNLKRQPPGGGMGEDSYGMLRVVHGGTMPNTGQDCNCASRQGLSANTSFPGVGFRIALDLK